MATSRKKKSRHLFSRRPVLPAVSAMLISAGIIYGFGAYEMAIAKQVDEPISQEAPSELLAAMQAREAALQKKEAELLLREKSVADNLADARAQLIRLEEAEERLSSLVSRIDEAAKSDIDQLTAVYSAMKPKEAAAVFSEMSPEFAAEFLVSMPPDHAASILASLDPKIAYTFSVLIAGRNAQLRTPKTDNPKSR